MIKKINKNKEPSKLAINFSNLVFCFGLLFSILILSYAIYKIFNPYYNITDPIKLNMQIYYLSILCAGISTIFFSFGLKKINYDLKINLSLLFLSIMITIYSFEIYLEISSRNFQFNFFNKQIQFDKRSKNEVIKDLNDPDLEMNFFPASFLESHNLSTNLFEKEKIYPLSSISNAITVFDNESGYFPIIKTDEHGFNNPKGLYIKNMIDIILIGDSFAESNTVYQDESIAAILRELGLKTITIAKGGNGPLLELASLIEYAKPLQPNLVLWLYYVNDFDNLDNEMSSSFLQQYLNKDDFSQNLILKQDKIDKILKEFIKSVWKQASEIDQINFKRINIENHWAVKISKLYNLRSKLSLVGSSLTTPTNKHNNYELRNIFKKILKKSKKTTLEWGGKMYFVYLPSYNRYASNIEDAHYKFLLDTVRELEIPLIDIHEDLFESFPDPLSLFPSKNSHYNAKGYKLIAETINNRLKNDNYISLESK